MSVSHTFFLPVKPNAAQRTRASCRGRFPQVHLDPKYRAWRGEAERALLNVAATEDFRPWRKCPVRIDVEAIFPRPKTTKLAAPRADNDNIEKGLWDAITCTGKWWADDSQIIVNRTEKRWARPGEEPGYLITIEFL